MAPIADLTLVGHDANEVEWPHDIFGPSNLQNVSIIGGRGVWAIEIPKDVPIAFHDFSIQGFGFYDMETDRSVAGLPDLVNPGARHDAPFVDARDHCLTSV
jgi:hypothetical protein